MKRSDQYRIDPAEAGATDYKTLPQTGTGHSNLDDTVERDRRRLAESKKEHDHPAPHRRPPPSKDANRPLHAREDEVEEEAEDAVGRRPGASRSHPGKGNPLV